MGSWVFQPHLVFFLSNKQTTGVHLTAVIGGGGHQYVSPTILHMNPHPVEKSGDFFQGQDCVCLDRLEDQMVDLS